jgi:hypothetical protein
MVRTADVTRGWGLYYSKSCKAKEQEARTGQNKKYHSRKGNYLGSRVDKETFREYQQEYGGIPQFHNGEYVGFVDGTFDNTAHQNHD